MKHSSIVELKFQALKKKWCPAKDTKAQVFTRGNDEWLEDYLEEYEPPLPTQRKKAGLLVHFKQK